MIKSKISLSTAFYPETNGQTKQTKQILEQYLRIFPIKSDWDKLHPLAKFEYNNSKYSGSGFSSFYTNYSIYLQSIWPLKNTATKNQALELYAYYLEETHQKLLENLLKAQARMIAQQNTIQEESK